MPIFRSIRLYTLYTTAYGQIQTHNFFPASYYFLLFGSPDLLETLFSNTLNLCSSPKQNITYKFKLYELICVNTAVSTPYSTLQIRTLKRLRRLGHVTCTGQGMHTLPMRGMAVRDCWEDRDVNGIILKLILQKQNCSMWTAFTGLTTETSARLL